ncbi:peptidase [Acidobacteria bacterium Mor1]|nr:peptidase [Acidobacteria bacterium Mor1]
MSRIPLETFFRKPARSQVRLSPDGTAVAYLAPYERRMNVFVRDLTSGEDTRITSATERDIGGHAWADPQRIVFLQDTGGDENYRLYAVGRDGSSPMELTPFPEVKCGLVDDLPDRDDEILIQMNRRDPQLFDVYRVNVSSGSMECIAENPGNVQRWITDHDGRLRVAETTDGVRTGVLYREDEAAPWRGILDLSYRETVTPLFFCYDREALYVSSNVGRDKAAIFEFDPVRAETTELIFEHERVDVSHLLHSRARRLITGVAFEEDRVDYHFFDAERERRQQRIDQALPETDNSIISTSRDESRAVVHAGGDRSRGTYYLYDVEEDTLEELFPSSPWLEPQDMSPMKPVRIPTSDGFVMQGYLTLPQGGSDRPGPLVMNPHGGPWARDSWGFNPEVQFLANRGYAVLQVNFRGSVGFGRKFWEASFGQWGLSMQDDITRAVRWAIDEGIADPKRVAIYGGSYGGYAALSGLTRTPELYACGVSYVGVSNLFTWIEAFPPYWKPFLEMIYEMVGHPERDAERWRETSPFFQADKIQVPLLVAQGSNDPRVRKEESDQIVSALRGRGVDVEYLVKDNEGHGFHNEENQFEFYRALEAFLEKNLA